MVTKYIAIEWPDIQNFMGNPKREYVGFDPDKNIWFVPEDMVNNK